MIACDEASYLISLRQDHPIGCRKQLQLRIHLLSCHLCRKYFHQIKQMDQLLDTYRDINSSRIPSYHLPEDKSKAIRQAIDGELDVK